MRLLSPLKFLQMLLAVVTLLIPLCGVWGSDIEPQTSGSIGNFVWNEVDAAGTAQPASSGWNKEVIKVDKTQEPINVIIRLLVAVAAGLICYVFLLDGFVWVIEGAKQPGVKKDIAEISSFCLSLAFFLWLYNSSLLSKLIDQVTGGLSNVVVNVFALVFLVIGGHLFWKKLKALLM